MAVMAGQVAVEAGLPVVPPPALVSRVVFQNLARVIRAPWVVVMVAILIPDQPYLWQGAGAVRACVMLQVPLAVFRAMLTGRINPLLALVEIPAVVMVDFPPIINLLAQHLPLLAEQAKPVVQRGLGVAGERALQPPLAVLLEAVAVAEAMQEMLGVPVIPVQRPTPQHLMQSR